MPIFIINVNTHLCESPHDQYSILIQLKYCSQMYDTCDTARFFPLECDCFKCDHKLWLNEGDSLKSRCAIGRQVDRQSYFSHLDEEWLRLCTLVLKYLLYWIRGLLLLISLLLHCISTNKLPAIHAEQLFLQKKRGAFLLWLNKVFSGFVR